MGGLTLPLQAAAAGLSILGGVQAGRAEASALKAEAARKEQLAKRQRAIAQRKAEERRRDARFAQSKVLARSAAGGGAADPTTRTALSRLEADGAKSALDELSDGEAAGRGLEFDADAHRSRSAAKKRATTINALTGGLSFAAKYGPYLDSK